MYKCIFSVTSRTGELLGSKIDFKVSRYYMYLLKYALVLVHVHVHCTLPMCIAVCIMLLFLAEHIYTTLCVPLMHVCMMFCLSCAV